ncbi:hypothetical protein BpHYR1_048831 [Brachionus plicatilis]|uniref:Uncharacterized protein n=1 Tax=Brachionus plicatilis TaxID=10195 RepID=A0A3M7R455_BRAPC|nr:hypothetical protein BpHYR1_048831 [Brachionus plicatilis]
MQNLNNIYITRALELSAVKQINNYHSASIQSESLKKISQIDALFALVAENSAKDFVKDTYLVKDSIFYNKKKKHT